MLKKIFQSLLRRFFLTEGRAPGTPNEWKKISDEAKKIAKEREKTKPFEGFTPKIVPKGGVDELLQAPVVSDGVKGKRVWDFSKKQKKGEVVDLFATEKEFAEDLYSTTRNFIKNDPMFNLELAVKLRNPGVKTYGWTPTGDRSKLLSPKQRQKTLDKLKSIMKHDEYQAQHAEELGYVDLTDDMFIIEKAEGGRIGMAGGGPLFKFIEKLFIKASNDIRLGKGKWKGLDQKQIAVQHDNLTKKMAEFQKSGKTVGLEEYFGVDPHTAFIGARDKVKRQGIIKQGDPITSENFGASQFAPSDESLKARELAKKAEVEAQRQQQIMEEAYNEIKGGSGFTGDYKYDADILADSLATVQGKVYDDLADLERSGLYDQALKRVQQDMALRREANKHMKDVEQKIELQMFDPKDRKPNAEGGRASLMYGGDPGFAFEYGGSWADWHDQHRDTMPVEQYIQTKLPKERLPFREMEEGGIARAGFPFGGQALKAIRAAWRANKTWGVGGPPYKPEATSFDVKDITSRLYGAEMSLADIREMSRHPAMSGIDKFDFKKFNKTWKELKADVLKTKLEESKIHGEGMISSAKAVPADNPTAEKVKAQFLREGKKQVEEATEGLKEIENYKNMLEMQGRKPHQSGGLAYMLGEPTYMKYGVGGSVGHAPWHKPTGQQQPQGQLDTPAPQVGGAQSPGRGQPNPMKTPRGLPSAAPRTMDPAFMQQQMMQKAMMGQGQGQRPRMEEGGMIPEQFLEDLKKRDYHEFLDKHRQWKENYERRKDLAPTQEAAGGGRIGLQDGGKNSPRFNHPDKRQGILGSGVTWTELMEGFHPFMQSSRTIEGLKKDIIDPIFKKKLKWNELDDYYRQLEMDKDMRDPEDIPSRGDQYAAQGGRIGFGLGGFNKARRAFLKMMAGITGAGVAAGTGLLKLGSKAAPKVIKEAEVITRGADGMPTYITDLIEVVKAKGVKQIMDSNINKYPDTVHSYKGVDVTEDAAGNIKIKSDKSGTATDPYTGKTHEGIYQENHIQIEKGGYEQIGNPQFDDAAKSVKVADEYIEGTVYPDMDGKMKDFVDGLDEAIHLDFKKIADEIDTLIIKKSKKASGGLAYALGE